MCALYHLWSTCWSNFTCQADHKPHSKEENDTLYRWCKHAFEQVLGGRFNLDSEPHTPPLFTLNSSRILAAPTVLASTTLGHSSINNRGSTLHPTLLSDKLGKSVQATHLQLLASSNFKDFVKIVPQHEQWPRTIVDCTFLYVNADPKSLASAQGHAVWQRIGVHFAPHVHANPKFSPVYIAKYDLANGYYHMKLSPKAIALLGVLMPMAKGEDALIAFPPYPFNGMDQVALLFLCWHQNSHWPGQRILERRAPVSCPLAGTFDLETTGFPPVGHACTLKHDTAIGTSVLHWCVLGQPNWFVSR